MSYHLLPFNFEKIGNRYLITNLAGAHLFLDGIEELIDSTKKLPKDIEEQLISNAFIANNEEQKVSFQKLLASSLSKKLSGALTRPYLFIVIPTLRCDHECSYCQVSRVSSNKKGFDLGNEEIPLVINKILKYGKEPYKVEFQGGEPLLRTDFIKEFVNQWEVLAPNTEVQFVIATSLSLLDQDFVSWMKDYPIELSISLDGSKLKHDHNRILPRKSSFDELESKLKLLDEYGLRDKVGLVSTITNETINQPIDIIEAHMSLGFEDMFVRPLSPFGLASKSYSKGYSENDFKEYYTKLLTLLITEEEYENIREYNAILLLEKIFRSDTGRYVDLKTPSGHIMGALIFNYDGEVYGSDEARMIDKLYNSKSLSIGNIKDNFTLDSTTNINLLSESFIHVNPGCEECAYLPYCGSDLMHHFSTQGDIVGDKSISRFCLYQKSMFETIFTLLENPEYKSRLLSWMR